MIVRLSVLVLLVCSVSAGITKREEHLQKEKQSRSDYSAPAYSGGTAAGGAQGAAGSQGNLYYYYYPVQESGGYPSTAAAGGDDFSALLALLLPLLLLGGLALLFLPLLGGGIVINTTGRRRRDAGEPEAPYKDAMGDLRSEINRLFFMYLNAVESEQCPERIFCEAGTYAGGITGKGFIFRMIDSFDIVPSAFKSKFKVLEKAAVAGKDMNKCKKYLCHPPKFSKKNQ